MTVSAFLLIPPTNFPKGGPISASIRVPAGAIDVQWWLVVAPAMQQKQAFRGTAEVRWRLSAGNFDDSSITRVRMRGEPNSTAGGIAGQPPGFLPNIAEMFDFDPRDSGGGSAPPDTAAEWLRITMVPEAGNNGGLIWCGCVIAATGDDGLPLAFDATTRGS